MTKKITKGVARIKKALEEGKKFDPIKLGDLDVEKDWSAASDGVEAAFLMTLAAEPKDYIISSGESHTVKEFVEQAFQAAGIEGPWVGEKLNEYYILPNYLADFAEFASQKLVTVDSSLVRSKSSPLLGDNSLIKNELNWTPKSNFKSLVKKMVEWDIQELAKTS
jgi:GDPmannose 4,6-dehydratase